MKIFSSAIFYSVCNCPLTFMYTVSDMVMFKKNVTEQGMHLFDQKYSKNNNNVKYEDFLHFFIVIYFKM